MRRKLLFVSVVVVAFVLMAASPILWSYMSIYQIPQQYELHIARNIDSQEEETALSRAENLNFSVISPSERFYGSTDSEDYLHPSTYLSYTYANFIDREVLDYYRARYDALQGRGSPRRIGYSYEANVTAYSDLRIYNSPAPEGVGWHNTTMVIVKPTPDGSTTSTSNAVVFYVKNETGYQRIEWDYDFNFADCYIVEMNLKYSETYAPLAAFCSEVRQIVVLDKANVPVLVGLGIFGAIS